MNKIESDAPSSSLRSVAEQLWCMVLVRVCGGLLNEPQGEGVGLGDVPFQILQAFQNYQLQL